MKIRFYFYDPPGNCFHHFAFLVIDLTIFYVQRLFLFFFPPSCFPLDISSTLKRGRRWHERKKILYKSFIAPLRFRVA